MVASAILVALGLEVGDPIIGLAIKLLWWALLGLAIGLLGRLIVPGANPIGWIWTILAGIAGAILGGVVGHAFDVGGFLQFILAVIFAALLIAIFAGGSRRAYA